MVWHRAANASFACRIILVSFTFVSGHMTRRYRFFRYYTVE
ncbi:hypothetical protein SIAM614_20031 [Stappia aggregata IAM 12614]|uniref:Uncharacterized protein n=1 Tax=Roseibium aggregatum (strain ATCC 25650 / DSM 13394 / JCM 20685 / NBRC 16684 / NCIMB 2208 / IAM 12614 / B1) TaxID=384765 RepID=A0NVY3_ROSAI|nr:hypothetical protein SIAM614_20031 [Stappia aggregata IAM 12614] [Roseibium aggregatum IAM 12614]